MDIGHKGSGRVVLEVQSFCLKGHQLHRSTTSFPGDVSYEDISFNLRCMCREIKQRYPTIQPAVEVRLVRERVYCTCPSCGFKHLEELEDMKWISHRLPIGLLEQVRATREDLDTDMGSVPTPISEAQKPAETEEPVDTSHTHDRSYYPSPSCGASL
jgi:hypothetical protein